MSRVQQNLVLLLLFVLSTGCEPTSTPEPTFTVRDSAGIEIVESSAPLLGPDAWTISEEPVLQIGAVEGEDPYLFAGIGGMYPSLGSVFRMEDGRIVVCNGLDATFRFFDQAGKFLSQFGGRGEGPGEFSGDLAACERVGDMIVGHQAFLRRSEVFDLKGNWLFAGPIPRPGGRRGITMGMRPDSLFLISTDFSSSRDLPPGVHDRTVDLFLMTPDGMLSDSLIGVRSTRTVLGDFGNAQAFFPYAPIRPGTDHTYYGFPDEYQIDVMDDHFQVIRRLRRTWVPAPVTEEDRTWWDSLKLNFRPGGREPSPVAQRNTQTIIDQMIFPVHHAPFDRFLVDRLGYLWVRHPHPRFNPAAVFQSGAPSPFPMEWDVFDPEGRWITTITLPGSFPVDEIGEDYILGVWKDELDVEYVRMYSLDRGG